jgi:hypothetical protein
MDKDKDYLPRVLNRLYANNGLSEEARKLKVAPLNPLILGSSPSGSTNKISLAADIPLNISLEVFLPSAVTSIIHYLV